MISTFINGPFQTWFGELYLEATSGVEFVYSADEFGRIRQITGRFEAMIDNQKICQIYNYLFNTKPQIGAIGTLKAQEQGVALWCSRDTQSLTWPFLEGFGETYDLIFPRIYPLKVIFPPFVSGKNIAWFLNVPKWLNGDTVIEWERALIDDKGKALVYADWCEEHGWLQRAEMLRANSPTTEVEKTT